MQFVYFFKLYLNGIIYLNNILADCSSTSIGKRLEAIPKHIAYIFYGLM